MNRHLNEISYSMTEKPIVTEPSATLYEAHAKMIENDVRRLPVVSDSRTLLGIITLGDILKTIPVGGEDTEENAETELLLNNQRVFQVMTSEPLAVEPDESIQDAAEIMLENKVSGLPVVEGGHLVGIITESDIFRLIVESWGEMVLE